jgi:hypothetical protein
MQTLDLPLHPTLRHPLTGAPLRALAARPLARRHGAAKTEHVALDVAAFLWPMMGGAPDDPPGDDDKDKKDPPDDKDKKDDDKKDPPDDDPDAKAKQLADEDPAKFEEEYGFPPKTPVEKMTPGQAAAYWKNQATVQTRRNQAMLKITGGKYGKDLQSELEEAARLRKAQMTDQERAIDDAKQEGRREALGETLPEFARTLLGASLAHVEEERRKVLVSSADVSTLIVDGKVDADKVATLAKALAPSDTGTKRDPNYGGGGQSSKTGTGVSAGRSRFQEEQERKKGKKAGV